MSVHFVVVLGLATVQTASGGVEMMPNVPCISQEMRDHVGSVHSPDVS